MNNNFISVVVPVYNAESTLRRCVDSVLMQSYTEFELLLLDDGSSDSSASICDEYTKQDKRVRCFHLINSGPSAARNKGIDEAKGRWIVFIDADDYVSYNYLDSMIKLGDEETLVIQNVSFIRDEKKIETSSLPDRRYFSAEYGRMIEENEILERGQPFAKLFASELLRTYDIRFDEKIWRSEDLLFLMNVLERVPNVYLSSLSEYYYDTSNSKLSRAKFSYESENQLYKKLRNVFYENSAKWGLPMEFVYPYLGRILLQRTISAYFSQMLLPKTTRVSLLREMKFSGYLSLIAYRSPILLVMLIKFVVIVFPVLLADYILLVMRRISKLSKLRCNV